MSETPIFVDARLLVKIRCELGECILYDDENDTLLWTDILGKKFHRLPLSDDRDIQVDTFEVPRMLGSFAMLPPTEPGYLCAWEDGFQVFDIEKCVALGDMSLGEDVNPRKLPTRLNDGRCAPNGRRFVCGGYFGELPDISMKVYKVEYDTDGRLVHSPIQEEIRTTNSICFAPDGTTMYLADSPTMTIHKFDYENDKGSITNKMAVHKAPLGVPDGSCVDAEGFIWNAVWRSGAGPSMVNRINPENGEIVLTVRMPDGTSQVTCCCFGGKDLDLLFISSAAESTVVSKEPNAGGIYVANVGIKGRKEARFVGKCYDTGS